MRHRFDARAGEWIDADDRLCSLFDLGGRSYNTTSGNATQNVAVTYIPSVNETVTSPPLVGTPPAGQGLQTINTALPGSAAWTMPYAYSTTSTATPVTASSSGLSLTTLLLLGAVGVGAFLFLKKGRR